MPERRRYYEDHLQMQRDRRAVEAILLAALVTAFAGLWRLIYAKLRDHRYGEIDSTIEHWGEGFDEDYSGALVAASDVLAGEDDEEGGGAIAANFEADTAANVGAGKGPAGMIAANIRAGVKAEIAKPGASDADILRRVKIWMDQNRANTIAQTDTTNLQSEATRLKMKRAGLGFWVWQTLYGTGQLDDRVCAECEERNGVVYAITDQMPPIHHKDRCEAMPLKEYLREHDQPFFGINERLQGRG